MYGTSEKSSRLGKVPVLRMGNINREGGLDWKDLVYSNNEEDIEKFKLLHNDLLFNRTNSSEWVGKTAIYKGERPAIYAGYIIRLRTIFVNADYINFVMNSQYHRNWCNDVKTDAVNQSNINAQKLSIFRVPLPPIEEQKRIVKEIKRWLSLIKVIKNGKENLQESIKQIKSKVLDLAIHGKLVPQDPNEEPAIELLKRINPKAEITCDTPQYGKLPKGWCSCTLRNVCSFTNGFAFSSDAYKNNGIPLVRISNITNEGKIDLNSCVYIQDEIDEQYIIEKGDFLVAMSGATTGKMGVYTYGEISYLNQRVGKIKASKALYTPYMHYLMYSQVDNILKMAYGGAQPNISAKAILAIRILLPPLAEQQRIVAKIEDLFTQFDKIEASL
jgi:type I restriction enzyme ecoAI specificity protein